MRLICPILLLLLAADVSAADAEITFKGVPMGVSEKEFTDKHPGYRCRQTDAKFKVTSDKSCTAYGKPQQSYERPKSEAGTFAGVPANIVANFFEDKLAHVSVYLFASHFEDVVRALTDRFGKPDSIETETVKNRMGAEFHNMTATWKRGDVFLTAERYGSDLTESLIAYRTTWGLAEFKRRQSPQRSKAAGDT